MIERKNYGITRLCESGKGKFISGAAWLPYPTYILPDALTSINWQMYLVHSGLQDESK